MKLQRRNGFGDYIDEYEKNDEGDLVLYLDVATLEAESERLSAENEALKAYNSELREILQDAIISHGTFIAYNPLEDAWQFRRIESRARELLEKVCS